MKNGDADGVAVRIPGVAAAAAAAAAAVAPHPHSNDRRRHRRHLFLWRSFGLLACLASERARVIISLPPSLHRRAFHPPFEF